uniref:Uncharacterized protein n=1 Tax=Rhizophora mucronata TaxID=61149 RepID=A0A2P2QVD0_RHIMU
MDATYYCEYNKNNITNFYLELLLLVVVLVSCS